MHLISENMKEYLKLFSMRVTHIDWRNSDPAAVEVQIGYFVQNSSKKNNNNKNNNNRYDAVYVSSHSSPEEQNRAQSKDRDAFKNQELWKP